MHGANMKITQIYFHPLNAELNPIYHLLALLGAHHIFHVRGLRVKRDHVITKRTIKLNTGERNI